MCRPALAHPIRINASLNALPTGINEMVPLKTVLLTLAKSIRSAFLILQIGKKKGPAMYDRALAFDYADRFLIYRFSPVWYLRKPRQL